MSRSSSSSSVPQTEVQPGRRADIGNRAAPLGVELQSQSLAVVAEESLDAQSTAASVSARERLDDQAQSWLNEAFTAPWFGQWSHGCPDGWPRDRSCRPFGEMVVRFSNINAGNHDAWATYMEEELSAFANELKDSQLVPWFRVNCSFDGCILAVAGHDQNKTPTPAGMRTALQRQAWAKDFKDILLAGCISCPGIDPYIVVLPRRVLDVGSNHQ